MLDVDKYPEENVAEVQIVKEMFLRDREGSPFVLILGRPVLG